MRGLTMLLMPALLLAQRPPASPAEAFDRALKQNRFGIWILLEDEGAVWGAAMRKALEEEPMVGLNLPLRVVAGGSKAEPLAAVLRERYGWPKGAHWAVVDGKGKLRAEGVEAPTPAGLAQAVDQAGLTSRIQELEAFLRMNPERLDARAALLREHLAVADRKTRKALGLMAPVQGGAVPPPSPPPPVSQPPPPPRALEPEVDLRVWAVAAQNLDALLRDSGGLPAGVMGFMVSFDLRRSLAEHSPSMGAVLGRHRAAIEEALRRQPQDDLSWELWITASGKCGGWPLQPLLAAIPPLPGMPPGQWLAANVLQEYVKQAKARGEWTTIREVLEPRWAYLRDGIQEGRLSYGTTAFLWDQILASLVEAQLAQGDVGAADQLLGEVAEVAGWPGLPARARDLAARLNRPDLAVRWGALTVKAR